MKSLLVGLGNPGKKYEKTRHNIGFRIVESFVRDCGWEWSSKWLLKGKIAQGAFEEHNQIVILEPKTFMNLSGDAVLRCMRKYGVPKSQLLVVADDIAIPFGAIRLRVKGSSGGHNGHRSIEASLGTQDYARLRVGVGDDKKGDLARFVLSPFTPEEEEALSLIVERAVTIVKIWLTEGLNSALNHANLRESG